MVHLLRKRRASLLPYLTLLAALGLPAAAQQVNVPIPGTSTSAPTAVDGIVYFLSEDKNLNAVHATDGTPVQGFPVDITAASADGSKPIGRPAVYFGNDGKGIYVPTDKAGVVRVNPDGSVKWVYKTTGATTADTDLAPFTVAVTAEGEVLTSAKSPDALRLVKLRASDGQFVMQSPTLTTPDRPAGAMLGSPSVDGSNIYTTTEALGLITLNRADLAVKTSMDTRTTLPLYAMGPSVFAQSSNAALYKMNRNTLTLDPTFGSGAGTPGHVNVNASGDSVTALFANAWSGPGGTLYAAIGRMLPAVVVSVDGVTGEIATIYELGSIGFIDGLVTDTSKKVLAFGASRFNFATSQITNSFVQLPLSGSPAEETPLPGLPSMTSLTSPVYDAVTKRFFITRSDDNGSALYGFDAKQ